MNESILEVGAARSPASTHRFLRWMLVAIPIGTAALACGLAVGELETGVVMAMAAISAPLSLLVGGRRNEKVSRRDRGDHEVLIVGRNRRTVDYLTQVEHDEAIHVVGLLDSERVASDRPEEGRVPTVCGFEGEEIPYLGDHRSLSDALARCPVDEVVITLPIKSCYDEITHCLRICQEAGIPASLSANFFELERPRPNLLRRHRGEARLCYRRTRWPRWQQAIKRVIDVIGSLVAIGIFAIPMFLIAIAVKLTSRGPLLYWQERSGQHGKTFRFPKFRSMVVNADELKAKLAHLNEQEGPVFKMKKDPRVTAIGRFIRKHSLDELPQLFCVLKGDMSLVGPRPPIPAEVEKYEWWQRRRLSVKPGLTCLWQCSGRNDIQFAEWMRLDLRYIDEWSLWLDMKLLLKTIPTVIRGSGV